MARGRNKGRGKGGGRKSGGSGNRSAAKARAAARSGGGKKSGGGGKRSSGGGNRSGGGRSSGGGNRGGTSRSSGGARSSAPRSSAPRGGASRGGSRGGQKVDTRTNRPSVSVGGSKTSGSNRGNASRSQERMNMSVRDRRAAAKEAGMSMGDYKAGLKVGSKGTRMAGGRGNQQNRTGLAKGNLGGTYGIRGRAATDAERRQNEATGAVMRDSGWAKTDHDLDYTLDDMMQGHYAHLNPNNDLYELGKERQSSEGLYQDRYNVGYHGEDDQGDPYASNSFMGSTKGYFDNYNAGKDNFLHAYKNYVGHKRDEGYAGDVLKLIDTGKIKNVSDDMYNMIVTDALNYDWDRRNAIAGKDAGQDSYDSRTGGMSQASITANAEHAERMQQMQTYAPSVPTPQPNQPTTSTSSGNTSVQATNNYQAPVWEIGKPDADSLNTPFGASFMQTMGQNNGGIHNPYTNSKPKTGFFNFNFDPARFQQGQ